MRSSARKPEVVSVTRCPPRSETSRAKTRIPMRRANGGRYEPPGSTKREPMTRSASPRSSGARSFASSPASCCPSPSRRTAMSYPSARANFNPVWTAPPMPTLCGSRSTIAPCAPATDAVSSAEASSTTTMSMRGSNARISSTTWPITSRFDSVSGRGSRAGSRRSEPGGSGFQEEGGTQTWFPHDRELKASHTVNRAPRPTRSSNRRAWCAYVCSSRTRSRARCPISSACPGSATSSRYAATASSALSTSTSSLPGSNQRSIPACGFETIAAPEDASSKDAPSRSPGPSRPGA